MTIRLCDACGSRLAPDEPGERLTVNGGPELEYDLCDKCGARFFAILAHHQWKQEGENSSAQIRADSEDDAPGAQAHQSDSGGLS